MNAENLEEMSNKDLQKYFYDCFKNILMRILSTLNYEISDSIDLEGLILSIPEEQPFFNISQDAYIIISDSKYIKLHIRTLIVLYTNLLTIKESLPQQG